MLNENDDMLQPVPPELPPFREINHEIPIIDESKRAKLLDKIAKEFGRKGAPIKPADISVPWNDSTGKSKG